MRETSSLTGVKCRATSVAKNQEEEKERQLGGTVSAMVMGRLEKKKKKNYEKYEKIKRKKEIVGW